MLTVRRWCAGSQARSVGLPVLVIAIVLVADALEGPKTSFVGLLAVTPMLSAVFGTPRCAAIVGSIAVVSAGAFTEVTEGRQNGAQVVRLVAITVFTLVAIAAAGARNRVQERAARADVVVAAVAEAITRPLPPTVAGHPVAALYHGADLEAQVGGDFYEVIETATGLRLVLGDVRGKGLAAVRLANYATGAFREAARGSALLEEIVTAMDRALRLDGGPEDFATALVAEVRDGALWAISCGHPAPAMLDADGVRWLTPPIDVPLGLGAGTVAPTVVAKGPGQVLLVTDGLLEARDQRGVFFDADAALRRIVAEAGRVEGGRVEGGGVGAGGLGPGPAGAVLLAQVAEAVRRHAGRLRDDVALLTLTLA